MRRSWRAALALVAVAMIAWLAILFRDSLLVARVSAIAGKPDPTPAELRHGLALAREARLLNPDRSVPLSWVAEMYVRQGRLRESVATYLRMVTAEPQLANAWFLIAAQAPSFDPHLAAHALAELHRLDPLYPR
jgi:hypothetical protein